MVVTEKNIKIFAWHPLSTGPSWKPLIVTGASSIKIIIIVIIIIIIIIIIISKHISFMWVYLVNNVSWGNLYN